MKITTLKVLIAFLLSSLVTKGQLVNLQKELSTDSVVRTALKDYFARQHSDTGYVTSDFKFTCPPNIDSLRIIFFDLSDKMFVKQTMRIRASLNYLHLNQVVFLRDTIVSIACGEGSLHKLKNGNIFKSLEIRADIEYHYSATKNKLILNGVYDNPD